MKLSLVTSTFLLAMISAHSSASAQRAQEAPEFFRAVEPGKERRLTVLPSAIRQRNVELDVAALLEGSAPEGLQHRSSPGRSTFTLFPDVVLHGTLAAIEPVHGDGHVASFSLEDDPHGSAYLSVFGEAVTGTFRTDGRLFQLHHVEGGVHTLSEVDELLLPSCGTQNEFVSGHARDNRPRPPVDRAMPGQILDMLVLYTDDARRNYGGFDGINSLINLAVFESNQGYAQSDVVMRLNLVHTHEVAFDEVGSMATWVSQLRNPGDGVLEIVHALRDAYGADAVSMITSAGDYCGMAYDVLTSLAVDQALNAFNVTRADCATGNYSFAHELGHSLGCQHDRAHTSGPALLAFAYGHRTPSGQYRSIMAYAPGTRLNLWSNPAKLAPNGEAMGLRNLSENWRVLNAVVIIASSWRATRDTGHQLTTTFAGGSFCNGNMFDLRPKDDITLTGIDIHTNAAVGATVQARMWFRSGSYVGFDRSPAGWQELALLTGTSAGFGRRTTLNFYSNYTLHSGSIYGIYVELLNAGPFLACTPGPATRFENDHVLLVSGVGKGVGFTGATILSRIWNGRLRYRGGVGQASLGTTFAGGELSAGNMFTVTPIRSLTLNSLDLSVWVSGAVTADVWYREGSYIGVENDPSEWTFVGTDFSAVAAGVGHPTQITVGDVDLLAGRTYSFYVNLSSSSIGQLLHSTNGTTSFSNLHLTIGPGVGRGQGAFTGAVFSPRIWNGRLRYTLL